MAAAPVEIRLRRLKDIMDLPLAYTRGKPNCAPAPWRITPDAQLYFYSLNNLQSHPTQTPIEMSSDFVDTTLTLAPI